MFTLIIGMMNNTRFDFYVASCFSVLVRARAGLRSRPKTGWVLLHCFVLSSLILRPEKIDLLRFYISQPFLPPLGFVSLLTDWTMAGVSRSDPGHMSTSDRGHRERPRRKRINKKNGATREVVALSLSPPLIGGVIAVYYGRGLNATRHRVTALKGPHVSSSPSEAERPVRLFIGSLRELWNRKENHKRK